VDLVASKLVGGLLQKHPDLVARMNEWIDDEHMWARRTAIIHQLNYKAPHFTSLWWVCSRLTRHAYILLPT
jgi:3-methyladenine DNA glycosylase AlkD